MTHRILYRLDHMDLNGCSHWKHSKCMGSNRSSMNNEHLWVPLCPAALHSFIRSVRTDMTNASKKFCNAKITH